MRNEHNIMICFLMDLAFNECDNHMSNCVHNSAGQVADHTSIENNVFHKIEPVGGK